MKIRHYHTSSRYSRSGYSLWFSLTAFLTRRAIITLTEVSNNKRVERLKKVRGWTFHQVEGAGKDECAIMTRNKVCRTLVPVHAIQHTERDLPSRGAPIHSVNLGVELIGGVDLWISVIHNAAHLDKLINRELNREANIKWNRLLRSRESFGWEVLGCGDHNRDWRKLPTRRYMRDIFEWANFTWERINPRLGTYENRLIDFSITTGVILSATVHRLNPSSDHRAYSEQLQF